MKLLSLPRESGVYGVWLASLLYALPNMAGAQPYKVLPGLTASILSLFTLNYVRYSKSAWRLLIIAVIASLYSPIIVDSIPYSVAVIALVIPLLLTSLRGTITGIVAGGGLIAFHGSLLYLSGSEGLLAFLPGFYGLLATAQAGVRVGGRQLGVTLFEAFSFAAVFPLSIWIIEGLDRLAGSILLVDLMLRVVGEVGGLHSRLPLKVYGFLEFGRSILIMLILGIAAS